ncbi:MAG: glycosyltransferase family 2 protein [bacterium]|nr:glycosyltransferase family 2 protein [bacterium]
MNLKLSIVTPCYNEGININSFFGEICSIRDKLPEQTDLELIYVDDGSRDDTFARILELAKAHDYVKYVRFSRNFGKEAAMLAGLRASSGDYVVILDADLQDPPSLIPEMYRLIATGEYDRIATKRIDRQGEPFIRSCFSRIFYKLINSVSDIKIVDSARDFSMMSRRFVDFVLSLPERSRFTKGIFEWAGYRTHWISFKNLERSKGTSKWSFMKLFQYSVEGIVSFSNMPLIISSVVGIVLFLFSFLMIVAVIIKKVFFGDPVDGWSSLVCIIFFVSGLQQMSIGILGSYLSRVFIETKNRPLYAIMDSNIEQEKTYGFK